jgi:hypothetical protein
MIVLPLKEPGKNKKKHEERQETNYTLNIYVIHFRNRLENPTLNYVNSGCGQVSQ